MFSITIAVGDAQWRLLYKDEDRVKKILDNLDQLKHEPNFLTLEDDFGQICFLVCNSVHGVLFEDLEKTKMAHVELGLHQARVQAAAQKAAQADPGLRANAMMNGPSVLSPMNSFRPS